jgi:hypothetical protein
MRNKSNADIPESAGAELEGKIDKLTELLTPKDDTKVKTNL